MQTQKQKQHEEDKKQAKNVIKSFGLTPVDEALSELDKAVEKEKQEQKKKAKVVDACGCW